MHLILTGATGLVGSAVLNAMIKTPEVTKISILSRRPVQQAIDSNDPRINVIIHKDFSSYPPDLISKIDGADGCVWALGISQTEVSKEIGLHRHNKNIPLSFAKSFTSHFSPSSSSSSSSDAHRVTRDGQHPFRFIYVSGQGTIDPTTTTSANNPSGGGGGLFTPFFAKIKAETELALSQIAKESLSSGFFKVDSIRPAFVDWVDQPEIKPYLAKSIGLGKSLLGGAMHSLVKYGPVGQKLREGSWSPTGMLGEFAVGMAMGRWEDRLSVDSSSVSAALEGGKKKQPADQHVQVLDGGMRVVENGWDVEGSGQGRVGR